MERIRGLVRHSPPYHACPANFSVYSHYNDAGSVSGVGNHLVKCGLRNRGWATFREPPLNTRSGPHRRLRIMRVTLRYSLLIGIGLAIALVPLGCSNGGGSSGGKRIILLTNGNSPFWDAGRAGMQEAEKDLRLQESG